MVRSFGKCISCFLYFLKDVWFIATPIVLVDLRILQKADSDDLLESCDLMSSSILAPILDLNEALPIELVTSVGTFMMNLVDPSL